MLLRNLLFFLTMLLSVFTQGINTDSLLRILPKQTDTFAVKTLNELSFATLFDDLNKGKTYAREALNRSISLQYPPGQAKALIRLGIASDIATDYDSALWFYDEALRVYTTLNDAKGKASALNNKAMVYNNRGVYDKAITMYFMALKAFESVHDTLGQANALNNIAVLYNDTYRYKLGLKYALQAFHFFKALGNKKGIAAVYTNIALSYDELNPDSSIYYHQQAIMLKEELNDKYGLGIAYNDLGMLLREHGSIDTALLYLNKAYRIKQGFDDRFGMASVLINRSGINGQLHRYKQQFNDLNIAYKIALQLKSYRLLSRATFGLSTYYHSTQNNAEAFRYHTLYSRYKDSLMTEESSKQINELEARYQTEKKDLIIANNNLDLARTEAELERTRANVWLLITIMIAISLLGLFFYIYYRNHRKNQLIQLKIEQEQLRNRAVIAAEDEERKRIAKDLHDGAGQQLSAVKMNLSAYASNTGANELNHIMHMLDDAVKEVRAVSHAMMPAALINGGLTEAIKDLAANINASKKLNMTIPFLDDASVLAEAKQTALYRVIQECVNNAIKHAQTSTITLQLIRHKNRLILMIEDNGKGFVKNEPTKGMGIQNIESRVAYIGGQIHIDSSAGNGTTITVDIPL